MNDSEPKILCFTWNADGIRICQGDRTQADIKASSFFNRKIRRLNPCEVADFWDNSQIGQDKKSIESLIADVNPLVVCFTTQDGAQNETYLHSDFLPNKLKNLGTYGYESYCREKLVGVGSFKIIPESQLNLITGNPGVPCLRMSIFIRKDNKEKFKTAKSRFRQGYPNNTWKSPGLNAGAITYYVCHPDMGNIAFISYHYPIGQRQVSKYGTYMDAVDNMGSRGDLARAKAELERIIDVSVANGQPTNKDKSPVHHVIVSGDFGIDAYLNTKTWKVEDYFNPYEIRMKENVNVDANGRPVKYDPQKSIQPHDFFPTWAMNKNRSAECTNADPFDKNNNFCYMGSAIGWRDRIIYNSSPDADKAMVCLLYRSVWSETIAKSVHNGTIGIFSFGPKEFNPYPYINRFGGVNVKNAAITTNSMAPLTNVAYDYLKHLPPGAPGAGAGGGGAGVGGGNQAGGGGGGAGGAGGGNQVGGGGGAGGGGNQVGTHINVHGAVTFNFPGLQGGLVAQPAQGQPAPGRPVARVVQNLNQQPVQSPQSGQLPQGQPQPVQPQPGQPQPGQAQPGQLAQGQLQPVQPQQPQSVQGVPRRTMTLTSMALLGANPAVPGQVTTLNLPVQGAMNSQGSVPPPGSPRPPRRVATLSGFNVFDALKPQTNQFQASQLQTNQLQPNQVQPNQVQPNQVQPNQVQTIQAPASQATILPIPGGYLSPPNQGFGQPQQLQPPQPGFTTPGPGFGVPQQYSGQQYGNFATYPLSGNTINYNGRKYTITGNADDFDAIIFNKLRQPTTDHLIQFKRAFTAASQSIFFNYVLLLCTWKLDKIRENDIGNVFFNYDDSSLQLLTQGLSGNKVVARVNFNIFQQAPLGTSSDFKIINEDGREENTQLIFFKLQSGPDFTITINPKQQQQQVQNSTAQNSGHTPNPPQSRRANAGRGAPAASGASGASSGGASGASGAPSGAPGTGGKRKSNRERGR